MANVIAVYSMKGGVGKTSIAVNLAHCSATGAGLRTLLWEIDAQGAASFLLGQPSDAARAKRVFSRDVAASELIELTRWPGLDLLAADISLRHLDRTLADADKPKRLRKLLQGVGDTYDCIILDCPPGLGEVSDQVFRAVDLIVVPVPPTPLALRALQQVEAHTAREHDGKPPLLPVLSMVDRRKALHRQVTEDHPDWSIIPQASVIERMAVQQVPVMASAPSSASARAFSALWERVETALKTRSGKTRAPKLARLPSRKPRQERLDKVS